MKNTIKFLGIIAMVAMIGLSMTACGGGGGGSGELTITGIPSEYNDKYIVAMDDDEHVDGTVYWMVFAGDDYDKDDMTITGTKIEGGQAVLNVWKMELDYEDLDYEDLANADSLGDLYDISGYDGSDSITLQVGIFSKPEYSYYSEPDPVAYSSITVKFKDGVASASWGN